MTNADKSFEELREEAADQNEKDNGWAVEHSRETYLEGWDACSKVFLEKHPAVRGLVVAIQRRMSSDDKCDHPFDENLGEALQAYESAKGKVE